MPEIGAPPNVPRLQRAVLRAVRAFSTPLLPDDYLELINPLWSTRELRGKVERIDHVTQDAATVMIKPGYRWDGHQAGQYVRIGVDIRGVRHWRAYSLTSEPGRPDGCISITPKLVEGGVVSPYLVRRGRPGTIVSLGGVEGDFVLPDPLPDKLLFISAGSGITPIISMLRSLCRQDALHDAVLLHSARTPEDVIFGAELRYLAEAFSGFRLHEQHTSSMGRLAPEHLDELCPDWRERVTFASGPGDMLDALTDHWEREELHRPAAHGAIPAQARRRPDGGGRQDLLPQERLPGGGGRDQSPFWWKARRPGSRCHSAVARASATRAWESCGRAAFETCATER